MKAAEAYAALTAQPAAINDIIVSERQWLFTSNHPKNIVSIPVSDIYLKSIIWEYINR